jgi:hypothetical protein
MESIEQLSQRIRKNPDDLDAWKAILALVDDSQKKQDCQKQIDRILANQQAPLLCPQCGGGMRIYFLGELQDKRARCPFCGTEIDIPDAFSRTVVEKREGFGQLLPDTDVTIYERRADNAGMAITADEIEKIIMDKGLIAARKELETRGIKGVKIKDVPGIEKSSEAQKILDEEGARAMAKSQGAILLNAKQANSLIRGTVAFFTILTIVGTIYILIQIFLK